MKMHKAPGNVLPREAMISVREHTMAPVLTVYDVLSNVTGRLRWGGAEAAVLLSVEAPEGQLTVGSEFTSTAEVRIWRLRDSSVITEAIRPLRFECVTDSTVEQTKNGATADWLLVHHYDISEHGHQGDISYTCRLISATGLPGALTILRFPVLRSLATYVWARASRSGLRRLIAAAETMAQGEPVPVKEKEEDHGKAVDK
ncbi:hypothetical protein ACIQC5_23045 [Paenarthrobacter sp. NPDC092416]|uniref:hypothetical protein n=1 Tax=Paenarthrobacter sp. NPDC092416 TaxID=3364386 RepID=UPI0038000FED